MAHSPRFEKLCQDARESIEEISTDEVAARIAKGPPMVLVDVREESEFAKGRIKTARHMGRGILERDIEAVTASCRECGAISKVIIEAALLSDDEKITACTLAKAAGADFVKTSTGFGPGGATAADVALMRRVVGAEMGVKAAGGVRDLDGLKAMVAAGASRVGARRCRFSDPPLVPVP